MMQPADPNANHANPRARPTSRLATPSAHMPSMPTIHASLPMLEGQNNIEGQKKISSK